MVPLKEKPTDEGRPAGETQGKDTIISAQTGLSIQKWLTENYHSSFTTDDVNKRFDVSLTDDEIHKIYKGDFTVNFPKFSYCKAPIKNTIPTKEISLPQLYQAITGSYYKQVTDKFRAMPVGPEKAAFKASKFDYVIFGGTFTERRITAIKQPSGYGCFDFDHVNEPETLKNLLIADVANLDVQMCFTSPSGDGLKIILFNEDSAPYDIFYNSVTAYLKNAYQSFAGNLDSKTKDISRACFVCYDENAFIKSEYLELWPASKN